VLLPLAAVLNLLLPFMLLTVLLLPLEVYVAAFPFLPL
jgi:hypothetical protein